MEGGDSLSDAVSAVVWLRDGHARLRRSVAGLDDAELARLLLLAPVRPPETG